MKLHEIHQNDFTESDIPIIYNLLQGLLKKGTPIRYLRFVSEPNVWVDRVEIEYDDISEKHSLCVTMHDKDAKTHAYETIAWEIPKMTDRLVLEKRADGYVFYDPQWVGDDADTETVKKVHRVLGTRPA